MDRFIHHMSSKKTQQFKAVEINTHTMLLEIEIGFCILQVCPLTSTYVVWHEPSCKYK